MMMDRPFFLRAHPEVLPKNRETPARGYRLFHPARSDGVVFGREDDHVSKNQTILGGAFQIPGG